MTLQKWCCKNDVSVTMMLQTVLYFVQAVNFLVTYDKVTHVFSYVLGCKQLFFRYQYIKEYKVGHHTRKRDHFARAVFVLIVGGIDNWHGADQQSTFTFAWKGDRLCWSSGGGGRIDDRYGEDQVNCILGIMIVPLRNVQPHYLRPKHGVATSFKNKFCYLLIFHVAFLGVYALLVHIQVFSATFCMSKCCLPVNYYWIATSINTIWIVDTVIDENGRWLLEGYFL